MSGSEYRELVLVAYDEQLASRSLSSEMLLPTPANIKAEIVKVCELGLNVSDEKILRSFVGQRSDTGAYRNAFLNGKADPFRPLVNFLNDRSIETNQRNIDLLALLIDFKPRPYHPDLKMPLKSGLQAGSQVPTIKLLESKTEITPPEQPTPQMTIKKVLLSVALILIVCMAGFLFIQSRHKHYNGHGGCMIWNDDHYEPTECNDKSSGKPFYPINHELVDHFKRIKDPDTLTLYSVGKVWYAKYDGRVEFFTAAGPYPFDSNRRVLPMSVHILQKYVLHTTN